MLSSNCTGEDRKVTAGGSSVWTPTPRERLNFAHLVDLSQETDTKAIIKQACATWGHVPWTCLESYGHFRWQTAERPCWRKAQTQIRRANISIWTLRQMKWKSRINQALAPAFHVSQVFYCLSFIRHGQTCPVILAVPSAAWILWGNSNSHSLQAQTL